MDEKLAKSIFAAGHRAGKSAGQTEQACFECGRPTKPETAEAAWDNHVAWRLAPDSGYHLDITNPQTWADIP